MGVCVLAAAQADLPRPNRRLYSRPLVALLCFLQPLERGLARYRSQLRFRPALRMRTKSGFEQHLPLKDAEVLSYWSDGSMDRYGLLRALLGRLEQDKWQVRVDTGWADYDLEILEARWSKLRLTTASECLDQGRLSIRCRLQTQWSLAAKFVFWALLGAEVLVAGLIGPTEPWIWMLLLTVPVVGWVLELQQAKLRHALTVLLDDLAREKNLTKLSPAGRPDPKPGLPNDAAPDASRAPSFC
jgi:hypothetical protein